MTDPVALIEAPRAAAHASGVWPLATAPPTPLTRPPGWCCGSWACRWTTWTNSPARSALPNKPRWRLLATPRITTRQPAAYLTREAWLQGVPFTWTSAPSCRAASSPSCWPTRTGTAGRLAGPPHPPRAGPVHRQRQPGRAGRDGLSRVHVDAADISPRRAGRGAHQCGQRHGLAGAHPLLPGRRPGQLQTALRPDPVQPALRQRRSMAALPQEYRAEPDLALAGGADGMDFVRRCCRTPPHMTPAGSRAGAGNRQRTRALRSRLPHLDGVWLDTSAGEDQVLLLTRRRWSTLPPSRGGRAQSLCPMITLKNVTLAPWQQGPARQRVGDAESRREGRPGRAATARASPRCSRCSMARCTRTAATSACRHSGAWARWRRTCPRPTSATDFVIQGDTRLLLARRPRWPRAEAATTA
jgi:ribosomal protein L3 glutamine methyltransferase